MKLNYLLYGALLAICSCTDNTEESIKSGLRTTDFETVVEGKKTSLYVLKNAQGMEVCVTNFGGRIVSLMAPDREGRLRDVVLGFDSVNDYITVPSDFGASIGRYANRIAQGRFSLDGVVYDLPKNNFGHCLHGGPKGFQYQVYQVEEHTDSSLVMSYLSKDGEEGFPGNIKCTVQMTLTANNALDISYQATTDKKTIVNMTNHAYFNLDGDPSSDNYDFFLQVNADAYTPVDSTFMTLGEIAPVANTCMDFRVPKQLRHVYDVDFEQLKFGRGVDHNWVLNSKGDINVPAASLYSAQTGIKLTVYTTEPGIQVYTGNFLDGTAIGKKGIRYNSRASVCLETQKYPDTPNKPQWPSCVLDKGEVYHSRCIYQFSIVK